MRDPLADAAQLDRGMALAEQAYERLRDAILSHHLPPGTRLSVPDVARRLGISRSPAREAIARIAQDGLADLEPRRGAVVAAIVPTDLAEIYELREVLEGLVCRLAAEQMSADDLTNVAQVLDHHGAAVAANDVTKHMEFDQAFHQAIRRATANTRLNESLDRLQGQIRLAMHTTRHSPGGMQQAHREHREILSALHARDPEQAERTARAHIARLRTSLRDASSTPPSGAEEPGDPDEFVDTDVVLDAYSEWKREESS